MKKYENLIQAMKTFRDSYHVLRTEISDYERTTGESVNDVPGFNTYYPLDMSFDEFPIDRWVNHVVDQVKKIEKNFKILNYEYLNTGGNTMVGIFTVWLPEEKQTVYAMANEIGCGIAKVDYISHDIEIDDYDEIIIESVDFDNLRGDEKYFELYRYCLNEYTKSDCRYFGCTAAIPYKLLSDELQSEVHADYLMWCEENNNCCVPTDGVKIIVHPDYDTFYDPHEDNEAQLQNVKDFRDWHNTIAGDEAYYACDYVLKIADREVHLPFVADVWNAVDELLQEAIENW